MQGTDETLRLLSVYEVQSRQNMLILTQQAYECCNEDMLLCRMMTKHMWSLKFAMVAL